LEEIYMLKQKGHHIPRPQSAEKPLLSIDAMPFARKVATKYQAAETGYRNELCNFFGSALISYRKFLKDPDGYDELLSQDMIWGLREKPGVKKTSRLVLYFLTNARSGAERNTAGKYARIVDYLHKERVDNAAAADHVRELGGMDAVLKKARGHEALKAADERLQDDDRDLERGEEPDETTRTLASGNRADDLFDREQDLSIRVGCETPEWVLSPEIDVTESFYLECKKTGPADDGIRIVGTLVNPPSR